MSLRPYWLERTLWLGTLACTAVALGAARDCTTASGAGRTVGAGGGRSGPPVLPTIFAADVARDDSIAAAAEVLSVRDPFRLSRIPGGTLADPVPAPLPATSLPPMPGPPRPSLRLQGIVGLHPRMRSGDARYEAVLTGVPDRDRGVLVQQGDTLGDLVVRRVGPDTVVVTGRDTTWQLTVIREW